MNNVPGTLRPQSWFRAGGTLVALLVATGTATAEESLTLERLRPAPVTLAGATIRITVDPARSDWHQTATRLKTLVRAELVRAHAGLREGAVRADYTLQCNLLELEAERKEEKRRTSIKRTGIEVLKSILKERASDAPETMRYVIMTASMSASFVLQSADGVTLASGSSTPRFNKDYEEGKGAPDLDAVVGDLAAAVSAHIAGELSPRRERVTVRLSRRGALKANWTLAQARQWFPYIESLTALPEKPKDDAFESDRRVNIGTAYEALAYEALANDAGRAQRHLDLAEQFFREAQQSKSDSSAPAEGLRRVGEARVYAERLALAAVPVRAASARPDTTGDRGVAKEAPVAAGLTNADVIDMVKSGLPDDVVLKAIQDAQARSFDLGARGLVDLKRAGVSDVVIRRMQGGGPANAPRKKP